MEPSRDRLVSIVGAPPCVGVFRQSHDYKIKFEHVKRLYQLPKENEPNNYFVVRPVAQCLGRNPPTSAWEHGALTTAGVPERAGGTCQVALDPPIRQGLTRYNFLVFQIPQDDDLDLTVKLTEYAGGRRCRARPPPRRGSRACRLTDAGASRLGSGRPPGDGCRQEIATKYRSEFKRRYEKAALTTVVGDIFKGFTGAKLVEASSQFARSVARSLERGPTGETV